MHPEEATGLLEKSLVDKEELKDIENVSQLLDALTYLPLAIAQATAYMNVYETPIVEYIRVFNDADAQNIVELLKEVYDDEVHYDSSQGAVATTWIVSFDRIRRTVPAAADLLSFMADVEPIGIPRSILPKLKTEQQMTQAIGTLTGHGFLSRREGGATFDMHSLVHLATPISLRNKAYRRTDELIPGILPQPETLGSIDWTATAVRKRSITWQLSALLNLNLPSIVDDRLRLESELVKRYILPDPEATFRKLMKNDFYNQEAWKLLRKTKSKSNRLYLVTGFITASESTWAKRFESTRTKPFQSTRNKTHTYKHVPDEQIIAVAYSVVQISTKLTWFPRLITRTLAVDGPERPKRYHLRF
ncbi:hypothetical protein FocnCong_v021262 [Fusarium oxysporum f. sp. conglutinans]|nr:hypothetical protein FocnCong_v021262 [Fusarium oxysporum f. sp. conglutinans]